MDLSMDLYGFEYGFVVAMYGFGICVWIFVGILSEFCVEYYFFGIRVSSFTNESNIIL